MGALILVIDDEAGVRRIVERMLTRGGHRVEVASDVSEAKARIDSQVFDLILCDVNLEGTTGHTLLEYARSRQPETAGMLMTGDSREEANSVGGLRYLIKPFLNDELTKAIKDGIEATQKNREKRESRARL